MPTWVWLSAAVEYTCDFLVGIVVFFGIMRVKTPPSVSIPSDSGVTSSSSRPDTSPRSTPPWIAAPIATASSGFTPRNGSLPKNWCTVSITLGMRVIPPTSTISCSSLASVAASFRHCLHGASERCTSVSHSDSSLLRDRVIWTCWGPSALAEMKGRLTSVCIADDSSHLAFSAASRTRCSAILSLCRSMPVVDLNSSMMYLAMVSSKSSPPRWVSPLVALTSKTPDAISRIEISNVPPPRSYTAMVRSWFLSRPKASAAAVGSLIMRSTFRPAIWPASLVAWRWASLKYAGHVTMALATFLFRNASAVSFILPSTKAPTCDGEYCLPLLSSTHASPLLWRTILYGMVLMSCCVLGSSKRRPIRRLTAKKVEPGFVTAWRLAARPTIFSAPLKATYDGVVRKPSAFSSTRGLSPSMTAQHE